MVVGAVAALFLVPAASSVTAAPPVAPPVVNPGFEADRVPTSTPTGWTITGDAGVASTTSPGHSISFALNYWSASAFSVETTQQVTGLTPGWYTLGAWIERGTGQNSSYITLRGCGPKDGQTYLPITGITTRNVPFDVIGVSFYEYWAWTTYSPSVQPERHHRALQQGRHRRGDGLSVHSRGRRLDR